MIKASILLQKAYAIDSTMAYATVILGLLLIAFIFWAIDHKLIVRNWVVKNSRSLLATMHIGGKTEE